MRGPILMPHDVRTVAVLGAGDMGHGIAEIAALRGYRVRLRDVSPAIVEKAIEKVAWSLGKLAEHKTITREQATEALGRIGGTASLAEALAGSDFVIEAVPENLDLKRRVFAEVEALAPAHAIFATNTSTMRVTEIAQALKDPSRLVGMHFFNPVLLMDLVEIIPGDVTSREAVDTTVAVSKALGKTTVVLRKDTPGFVTSRLIGVWVGAGVLAHEHGLAAREDVDAAMRFTAGFPMGPFELADYTGLDVGYHAAEYIASRLGNAYRPAASLEALVKAGKLGKKTGSGFYSWDGNKVATRITSDRAKAFDPAIVMAAVANEAAKLLDEGVASAAEIDLAMRNGTAFPKGPLEWADSVGLDKVLRTLVDVHERTGEAAWKPYDAIVAMVESGRVGRSAGRGFHEHPVTAATPAAAGDAPAWATIRVDVDPESKVGVITFNRPHRLHAINGDLIDEVTRAFRALEAREDVRAVVVTGSGEKAFCAGADLSDTGASLTPAAAMELARRMNALGIEFERSAKPIVAAINGVAYGGGMEWTLACDFRLAARRAKMGLTEVTLGLIPAAGGTQRLPKLVGLARAKEIVLLGDKWSADDMLRMGVLHRVFENEDFEKGWRDFAARLARGAPVAQALSKRALAMAPTVPTEQGMEFEAVAFAILLGTEDAMEGISSMFQKKAPEFKGR